MVVDSGLLDVVNVTEGLKDNGAIVVNAAKTFLESNSKHKNSIDVDSPEFQSIDEQGILASKDTPEIIIENSKIDREKMQKNRFTLDELMQELRNQGLSDTTQIEYAVLETNGQLNVILQKSEQPVTPSQLGIPAGSDGYAHIIINEGRILDNNLRMLGRDRSWLDKEIKRQGAASTEDVYLLTLTETGKIFCQRKEQAK